MVSVLFFFFFKKPESYICSLNLPFSLETAQVKENMSGKHSALRPAARSAQASAAEPCVASLWGKWPLSIFKKPRVVKPKPWPGTQLNLQNKQTKILLLSYWKKFPYLGSKNYANQTKSKSVFDLSVGLTGWLASEFTFSFS